MFRFLTHRSFWINLVAAILFAGLIVFGFLQLLGRITKHGEYLTVPGVIGKSTPEAIKFLEGKGFEVIIQDSVFIDTAKRGIVLKQLPDPNSTVKINRSVYLTVNRVTLPLVDMPGLEGKTFNFALEIMRRSHLELGDTVHQSNFMKGSVLEQSYNGNRITMGSKLPWGSKVDLVIASGLDEQKILVPSLLGLTFSEAKLLIEMNGIELGAVVPDADVKDTLSAYVYRQSPPRLNDNDEPVFIQSGQLMDIWISQEMRVPKDSTSNF